MPLLYFFQVLFSLLLPACHFLLQVSFCPLCQNNYMPVQPTLLILLPCNQSNIFLISRLLCLHISYFLNFLFLLFLFAVYFPERVNRRLLPSLARLPLHSSMLFLSCFSCLHISFIFAPSNILSNFPYLQVLSTASSNTPLLPMLLLFSASLHRRHSSSKISVFLSILNLCS